MNHCKGGFFAGGYVLMGSPVSLHGQNTLDGKGVSKKKFLLSDQCGAASACDLPCAFLNLGNSEFECGSLP